MGNSLSQLQNGSESFKGGLNDLVSSSQSLVNSSNEIAAGISQSAGALQQLAASSQSEEMQGLLAALSSSQMFRH